MTQRLLRGAWRCLLLILILEPCGTAATAQVAPDAQQAKRDTAAQLFSEGKRLEALPLLQELVAADPGDRQMLVALAACLVEHAATLTDEQAAGKERLRARDLLDSAWKLGDRSPMGMNLSQLLRELPQSGSLTFSHDPKLDQALRAGEAAFSQRDFTGALRNYGRAIELDPGNYDATLFTGNTYDRLNEFVKGADWYSRAIALNPDVETAYRYYADMLARQGDMAKARTMLVHAAVAEPYNPTVWRELRAWASLNKTHIGQILISPAAPAADPHQPGGAPQQIAAVWRAYRAVRERWQKGDEFKRHFPAESQSRHSLPEEADALTAAAQYLEKLTADKKLAAIVAGDENLRLLSQLYEAGLIEPYVLFSLGDTGIARDYSAYRASHRQKLEDYMNQFVVPPRNH